MPISDPNFGEKDSVTGCAPTSPVYHNYFLR